MAESPRQRPARKTSRHLYSIEYDSDGGVLTPLHGQPIIDLYRSLTIGGIVAFVGSGNSMALGYGSWDGLSKDMLKLAATEAGKLPEDARLRTAIQKAVGLTEKEAKADEIDKFDRLALATEMLRQSSAEGSRERDLELCRLFAFRNTRTIDHAQSTLRALRGIVGFADCAAELDRWISALGKRGHVPIDYVPGIKLAAAIANLPDDVTRREPDSAKTQLLDTPSPTIDVLGTLRKEWKVSRYATLNYDHEIERMLERTDFPFESLTSKFYELPAPTADLLKRAMDQKEVPSVRSRLGEKARSVDLDRSNVGEFMLFAADSPAGVSQVLHLHGSVRDPSQMIVTDIDYNQRYFVNTPWNQVLEDSQELLYRANAIVFIGTGMSEEVLFRAMRILSQAPEREDRPVYAFMESKNEIKDTADGIKLFQRYGIRTIYYGTRLEDSGDPETGDFHLHPLVQSAFLRIYRKASEHHGDGAEKRRREIARKLNPLSKELAFLKKLDERLSAIEDADAKERQRVVVQQIAALDVDLREMLDNSKAAAPSTEIFSDDHLFKLPRLMLTPWHRDVLRLVLTALQPQSVQTGLLLKEETVRSLREAVSGLRSVIHSRALQDALQAISAKSIEWRKRWQDRPQKAAEGSPPGAPHFRDPSTANFYLCEGRVCAHNISRPHDRKNDNRAYLEAILTDEKGDAQSDKAFDKMRQHRVIIARARNGSGKGMLAARLMEKACPAEARRLVLSFGQSCGRDSVFDLMAYWHPLFPEGGDKDGLDELDIVLSHVDIAMTNSEGRPKLAEWDAFFRQAIAHDRARWLLLCENLETVEYFRSLCRSAEQETPIPFDDWVIEHDDALRRDVLVPEQGPLYKRKAIEERLRRISAIARKCRSVWVASFLTSVHAELLRRDDTAPQNPDPGGPNMQRMAGSDRFDDILRKIDHVLNITQDPRQRVPNLIDTAISQIEAHVLRHRSTDARITKVLSHAILKHLFAFGGPVETRVFARCPEFLNIMADYKDRIPDERVLLKEIVKARRWLRRLDMVTELTDCYSRSGGYRYGLHAHVRNWLATKKGLPFSVVVGREQTAVTVIPVIDDEIAPLDQEDYDFIWKTVDGLLRPAIGEDAPRHASVRAAYMLLRGSMRVGSVLRSAHGNDPLEGSRRTTLDEYLRRLLDLRHAALVCAKRQKDEGEPMFEREWVWLFNELGVVKLLQGQAHDASALFEQAIEFEKLRISKAGAFERLIYRGRGFPDFSVTKLRIMTNLAMAEIERGAFNRASRILSSEHRDIRRLEGLFSADADGKENPRRLHREIRILVLVLGLVDARLKFLCGGAGEAMQWLENHEKTIVGEGVHGLTALYYLIRADVESGRRNHAAAAEMFATARAEAEASGRSDLIFSVMLGESELRMAMQRQPGAGQLQQQLARIRKIKHEAERLGMSRIVVTACMLRARLYMGFGEFRSARQDLMTALTKATNCGLHLKRTSALIDMAALVGALDASLREEARDIARSARFDAERMGYKLAAARAKDLELVLREQGSIEDWLFRAGAEKNGVRDEGG